MEVNIEEVGPCRNRVRITLPQAKVEETFEKHYRDLKGTIRIKGFRPGKVPRSYLERKFGEEIAKQVKVNLIEETLDKAFEENKLDPIGKPEIDLDKILVEPKRELTFEAVVEVRPKFELGTYTGIKVERSSSEVTEDEVEEEILSLQRNRATLEPCEGDDIGKDDVLFASAKVLVGDREVNTDENVTIGPRSVHAAGLIVPDLRERAVEAGVGGTVTFDATLPRFFPDPDLREKPAKVILDVHEAKRMVLPEVNDAFAEELDFDDVAELREKIQEALKAKKEARADREVEDRVIDKILEETPFSIPEGLLAQETERIAARARLELEFGGKTKEEIDEALAEHADQQKAAVERSIRVGFLLDSVAKKERIYVTEDELNRHFEMIGARDGRQPEEVRQYYQERDMLSEVRFHLREAKTRAFLREKADIA
jgi:trigger factor